MEPSALRAKLIKIMPGYNWTVHKAPKGSNRLIATGIQSSGFNRTSTLEVQQTIKNGADWFTVKSSGYGRRALWLAENSDATLARAIRGLQDHYQRKASEYGSHAAALECGRKEN